MVWLFNNLSHFFGFPSADSNKDSGSTTGLQSTDDMVPKTPLTPSAPSGLTNKDADLESFTIRHIAHSVHEKFSSFTEKLFDICSRFFSPDQSENAHSTQPSITRHLGYNGAYEKYELRANALNNELLQKNTDGTLNVYTQPEDVSVSMDQDHNEAIRLFFEQVGGSSDDLIFFMILNLKPEGRKALFAHAYALRNSSAPIPNDVEKHLQVIDRLINKLEIAEKEAQYEVVKGVAPEAQNDPLNGYLGVVNSDNANQYLQELEQIKGKKDGFPDAAVPQLAKNVSPEERLLKFRQELEVNGNKVYIQQSKAKKMDAGELTQLFHYAIFKLPKEDRDMLLRDMVYLFAKDAAGPSQAGELQHTLAICETFINVIVNYKSERNMQA